MIALTTLNYTKTPYYSAIYVCGVPLYVHEILASFHLGFQRYHQQRTFQNQNLSLHTYLDESWAHLSAQVNRYSALQRILDHT